ncbi:MAG TPA: SDR family NAD(P)-dependent oxidoreductase [Bacteroidales bacterium]|nr:SDR family NAD(P)-dependent oxidoreductase [Bacteroidales bacterium]
MELFAVITGAAGGLGKAFSFELAKNGYNTILLDLPEKGLKDICTVIENRYNKKSLYYETDLTKIENIVEVTSDINQKYNVSILINNAGVGGTKSFRDADINYLNTILQLNIMATTIMTKQLFQNLEKQDKSYILNVSSMAAFSPVAFKTVYPASKVFVHYFSRSLYEEYKKTNVFVSVVNPGPMKTNPDVTARINRQGFFGRIGLLSPEKVAEISIRQLFKRDTLVMLKGNGLSWLLLKIIPIWIRLPLFSIAVRRELKLPGR